MRKTSLAALALLAGCDGSVAAGAFAPDGGIADAAPEAAGPRSPLSAGMEVIDFGCVGLHEPVAFRVQIENTGATPVGPLAVNLTPSDAMLLLLTDGCSEQTLAAGEACQLSIFFMAATPVTTEATLEVTSAPIPPLRLPVRAQASPLADKIGSMGQPAVIDFGSLTVGMASGKDLVMVNIGDQASTPPAATVRAGQDFQIVADHCSGQPVPPLGTCTVSVLFLPRTAGKHMDLLRLGSGQTCDPFPPVTLTGTGL